jgi:hypothetical protein
MFNFFPRFFEDSANLKSTAQFHYFHIFFGTEDIRAKVENIGIELYWEFGFCWIE